MLRFRSPLDERRRRYGGSK